VSQWNGLHLNHPIYIFAGVLISQASRCSLKKGVDVQFDNRHGGIANVDTTLSVVGTDQPNISS
jgi:hypothetical protein